jgi:hypothetical protein
MTERVKTADEVISGEIVLPSQFFRNWRGERALKSAECQLLVAVLFDAVECFQKHLVARDPAGQRLFRDAVRWIMEQQPVRRDEPSTGFSFDYICDVLGIDADRVRNRLRNWADSRLKGDGARTESVGSIGRVDAGG